MHAVLVYYTETRLSPSDDITRAADAESEDEALGRGFGEQVLGFPALLSKTLRMRVFEELVEDVVVLFQAVLPPSIGAEDAVRGLQNQSSLQRGVCPDAPLCLFDVIL